MKICFISYAYPGRHNTGDFAFVKQLVDAIASQGHQCHVVAPFNILHYRRFPINKEEYMVKKGIVKIYRPVYFSLGNFHLRKFIFSFWLHQRAVKRALRRLDIVPDAIYGHFWNAAYEGYDYAKVKGVPLFVATGESEIVFESDNIKKRSFCDYVRGVICVSSKNLEESINKQLTTKEKCIVLPNAIDSSLFKDLDKQVCRKRLNFPHDAFIVAFVGWFNERKGALRLSKAISKIDQGKEVYSLFIGKGHELPDCDNILFKGALPHSHIPEYLNAADIFVLPTLQEGCCNAVVEAMACGLPVVSSNLPFNWDVLNKTNSILVNPNDIEQISEAIIFLRDNAALRQSLSVGALKTAENLTINRRASEVVKFIEVKMNA